MLGPYLGGVIFVLARAVVNLLRLPFLPFWLVARFFARPRGRWILVRLRPRLSEMPRPITPLLRLMPSLQRTLPTPLELLRRTVDHVLKDPKIDGVVFEIPHLMTGWATCASVRDIMARLRAGGRNVVAYLPRGGGNKELFVASGADCIYVAPQATLMPLGLSIESKYVKPLLDKVGVQVETFARAEYKTAAEPAVRDSMSDAQREQLTALLGRIDEALVDAVAARPGMDGARAREAFRLGMVRGEQAREAGLVDGICYEDELPLRVRDHFAKDGAREKKPPRFIRAPQYLAYREKRFFRDMLPRPYIAVVEVHGAIAETGPRSGQQGADLDRIVAALRAIRRDRWAVGCVLHVDSPGGSALASDLMHREIVRLRERKPVVAYFGDVAASGGYYIGVATQKIFAQPVTITGSIGVVSAKMMARSLMDRVGVRTEVVRTGPHADMFSTARALDEDERKIVDREIDGMYRAFVSIVADGRGRSTDEIEPLARGRVWAGADALERGLVDTLGGMELAIDEVRRQVPLPEALRRGIRPRLVTARRMEVPPPEPPEVAKRAAEAAIGALVGQDLVELVQLCSGGERVLFYAPLLPRID